MLTISPVNKQSFTGIKIVGLSSDIQKSLTKYYNERPGSQTLPFDTIISKGGTPDLGFGYKAMSYPAKHKPIVNVLKTREITDLINNLKQLIDTNISETTKLLNK